MSSRDSFVFRKSLWDIMKNFSDDIKADIFNAIGEYVFEGKCKTLNGVSNGIWGLIKLQLDKNAKLTANGKKGGRPVADPGEPRKNFGDLKLINITEEQYQKLISKHGKAVINLAIRIFDNWLERGSKAAKQYIGKNHYAHFKVDSWAIQKALTELEDKQNSKPNWSV